MDSRATLLAGRDFALAILALLLLGTVLAAQEGRYSFRVYEHPDGLDDLVIRDLVQDRAGFLWVATHTGLYRFDGRRFERFTTEHGLPDNWVTNLLEDAHGELWVATIKGICRRNGSQFELVLPSRPWLSFRPNSGTPLAADREGNLFLAAKQGLFAIWRTPRPGDAPLQSPLRAERLAGVGSRGPTNSGVLLDRDGWLWYSDEQNRLVRRHPSTGRAEIVDPELPAEVWTSILQDRQGTVWVADAGGRLFHRSPGADRFRKVPIAYSGQGRVRELHNGGVLVPLASGFAIVRGKSVESIDTTVGLPGEVVECFLEDRDGNLWIGTVGTGLIRWQGGLAWRSWGMADGMPGDFVTQVVPGPRKPTGSSIWVGTLRGLVTISGTPARARRVELPRSFGEHPPVYALTAAPEGMLWLSAARGVLHAFDPATGQGRTYGAEEGFSFGDICHILVRDGLVWVAHMRGLDIVRPSPQGAALEHVWPPGESASVYRIGFDSQGILWAATSKGLLRKDRRGLQIFGKNDGLQADDVFGLSVAPDDAVWIHYRLPLGVSRAEPASAGLQLRHYGQSDGLPSNKVFSIVAQRANQVWVGTESGVGVYTGAPPWVTFGRDHGLIWNDCNFSSLATDSSGAVWIGTGKGLSRFRVGRISERPPPPVAISEIRSGRQRLFPGTQAALLASDSAVSISFAALRFTNPGAIRFRYRLNPADPWIETPDREVSFARLSPGVHRFEVAASEGDGRWTGRPAALALEVPTPWWQQWWARALFLWAIIATMRLLWRWRFHRMIRRQAQLETAVGERTRELEVQRERAEAASRFKDQILSNVSHEIRTPLNGIVGFTSLVLESDLDEEQREQLRTVYASGRSLVDIIEDLLDFASIEAGDMRIQERAISLAEVMDQTERTLRFEAQRRGLEFRSVVAEGVPAHVVADDHRLRQVLMNLAGNAIKFTEAGSVEVRLTALTGAPAWCSPEAPRGSAGSSANALFPRSWFLFEVADTGIGIAPEHLEQIFEPFRQLDGTSRRIHGGTGLGLALVRRIASLMGGAMAVESELGKGSVFRVALPLAVPPHGEISQPAPAAGVFPGSAPLLEESAPIRRVLIAEDNPVNQRLLHRILATRGLEVYAVADGQAALNAAERESFDLILMDIQMPVMDGIEATRRIRERELHEGIRRVPVIAVTANGMFQCREECFSVGMDGYLVKPFGPANLFEAIDAIKRAPSGITPASSPAFASVVDEPEAGASRPIH